MQFNRGQIGQTATWVVGTIIILVVVFVFVYAAGLIGNSRNLGGGFFGVSDLSEDDLVAQQIMFGILEYEIDGKTGLEMIKEGEYDAFEDFVRERIDFIRENGEDCSFTLREDGVTVFGITQRNMVMSSRGGIVLDIDNKGVSMRC